MRDRKKAEEPQEEGSPAWMNTYGDMVTLLLTFFVLLFSFSTVDAEKWEDIVNSLSGLKVVAIAAMDPNAPENTSELGEGRFVITSSTPSPSETPTTSAQDTEDGGNVIEIKERFEELYEKIKNHIETHDLGYILNVEYVDENTILLRMSDSAFFDPGEANIDEDAKVALDEVCEIIEDYTDLIRLIRIEGHTDNVPISNAHFADNWELSMARADKVRKYVMNVTEIDPALLVACYFGEYHPVATNDTLEGRAKNRRVDFVIESILKDE